MLGSKITISGYEQFEKIGRGGFGVVYKARRKCTGQCVAIKVLTIGESIDELGRERLLKRFERETQLGAKLVHPNIVRLLDKGDIEGKTVYAVFEYIQGRTLKELLDQEGPLSAVDTAHIMGQILDALACAHNLGIVHRDIKPLNIMISSTGAQMQAHLLDFGIAGFSSEARTLESEDLTMASEMLGTPLYCAPEQLRGEPPTPKSDLYSWGLVFLECLTNQPAVPGSSNSMICANQLSSSNISLPSAIVGHPVTNLLRRVLHKNVNNRSGDTVEIYRELKSINFFNLVGDLCSSDVHVSRKGSVAYDDLEELTKLDHRGLFARLNVFRKQITALSIILHMKVVTEELYNLETADALLYDQFVRCKDIAIFYGGYAVGELSDTLYFYYGHPRASDNDSRLCARSALDIVSGIIKQNTTLKALHGFEFQVYMGIHSDMVNVYAGEIPIEGRLNKAMILARNAMPNQILCSNSTRGLLGNYYDFGVWGDLNNAPEGIETQIFALLGEREVESIGFLRGARNNNKFIGREMELRSLTVLLGLNTGTNGAASTKIKLAHVYGLAGIGKSRLVEEFRRNTRGIGHCVVQCLPEYKCNALYPILEVIRSRYSVGVVKPDKLYERLGAALKEGLQAENVDESLVIFASWLGLILPDDVVYPNVSLEKRQLLLFEALSVLLCKMNDNIRSPTLFIFEDIHWADPTTIAFIGYLVSKAAEDKPPHRFISTSREPLLDVLPQDLLEMIHVKQFNNANTQNYISNLFDNTQLSAEVKEVIIGRAEGNPLYIEELVTHMKQNKAFSSVNGKFEVVERSALFELPYSLLELLQHKLDDLEHAKNTAQFAATLGREFDVTLLRHASDTTPEQLQRDLNELIQAEIVFVRRKVGEEHYVFKHSLVQSTIYFTISPPVRRDYHLKIAGSLAAIGANHYTDCRIVADHFYKANKFCGAVEYGIKYGEGEASRFPSVELGKYFGELLKWNENIVDSLSRHKNEKLITDMLLQVSMATEGYGSDSVGRIIERSSKISKNILSSKGAKYNRILNDHALNWNKIQVLHTNSEHKKALSLAKELVQKARAEDCRRRLVDGLPLLGLCLMTSGELDESIEVFQEGLVIYREEDTYIAQINGVDPKCHGLSNLAHALAIKGDFESAMKKSRLSIDWAESFNHPLSKAFSYCNNYMLMVIKGDRQWLTQERPSFEDTLSLYPDFKFLHLHASTFFAWLDRRCDILEKNSNEMLNTGQTYMYSLYLALLAKIYCEKGDIKKAIEIIENAVEWANSSGELAYIGFIGEVKGSIDKMVLH